MKIEIKLTGIVQGVGCRYYCANVARRMGLHGSATNCADGSVRIVAEVSDKNQAQEFAIALKNNSYNLGFWGSISESTLSHYTGSMRGDVNF